jgi:hypothetical protein
MKTEVLVPVSKMFGSEQLSLNIYKHFIAVKDLCENWNYCQHLKEKEADETLQIFEKKCKENCVR